MVVRPIVRSVGIACTSRIGDEFVKRFAVWTSQIIEHQVLEKVCVACLVWRFVGSTDVVRDANRHKWCALGAEGNDAKAVWERDEAWYHRQGDCVRMRLGARPEGFEPPTGRSEVCCSDPLSYGRNVLQIYSLRLAE